MDLSALVPPARPYPAAPPLERSRGRRPRCLRDAPGTKKRASEAGSATSVQPAPGISGLSRREDGRHA
ncbi:hypothetical protein ADL02_13570 [Streptomyces sp. NRRL WC-3723]|nr:hypothetical protein ADL02_13570 [Streptomyces sp. NRRL WC-3723]